METVKMITNFINASVKVDNVNSVKDWLGKLREISKTLTDAVTYFQQVIENAVKTTPEYDRVKQLLTGMQEQISKLNTLCKELAEALEPYINSGDPNRKPTELKVRHMCDQFVAVCQRFEDRQQEAANKIAEMIEKEKNHVMFCKNLQKYALAVGFVLACATGGLAGVALGSAVGITGVAAGEVMKKSYEDRKNMWEKLQNQVEDLKDKYDDVKGEFEVHQSYCILS